MFVCACVLYVYVHIYVLTRPIRLMTPPRLSTFFLIPFVVRICVCVSILMSTHICMNIYICVCVCVLACSSCDNLFDCVADTYLYTYMCMRTCVYVNTCMCMYIHVCVSVCAWERNTARSTRCVFACARERPSLERYPLREGERQS